MPFLERYRVRSSLCRPGNRWDNAVAKSVYSTLKLHRYSWPTRAAVRSAIVAYIEGLDNRERPHNARQPQSGRLRIPARRSVLGVTKRVRLNVQRTIPFSC
jgi:transposase InsO family protein